MATGSGHATELASIGGRAIRPGPRRRVVIVAAAVVVAAAVALVAVVALGGRSHPGSQSVARSLRYGKIPDWIPKQRSPSDQIVAASAAHPVLAAVEGDTINAHLPAGSAYVTAVGPSVPNWVQSYAHDGKWTAGSLAPSTFSFTIAAPKGVVPLRADDFSILTSAGQIIRPALTLTGGGGLPATVKPGQSLNLTLRTQLPEGEGALRWAFGGSRVLVAWFYELELD